MDWIEVFIIIGTTAALAILFGGIAWVIRYHERISKQKKKACQRVNLTKRSSKLD